MADDSKLSQIAALPRRSIFGSPKNAADVPVAPRPGKNALSKIEKRGRGRPKIEGIRPWQAEGISRALWYRRKKEAGE